jgi:hypothetical protein
LASSSPSSTSRARKPRNQVAGYPQAFASGFSNLVLDVATAADAAEADADSPLRRDAEEPSVLPGVPLS